MSTHPTFGVEEEFLLVDPDTGEPVPLNRSVADRAARSGVELQLELTSCQVETTSSVASSSTELSAELARLRRVAAEAHRGTGPEIDRDDRACDLYPADQEHPAAGRENVAGVAPGNAPVDDVGVEARQVERGHGADELQQYHGGEWSGVRA